jgi:uncharacterized protein (TIGR02646 family)
MRLLKRRPSLPKKTRDKLASQKSSLMESPTPAKICEQRFDGARSRKWFNPIREALKNMAGDSQTCMFCDHNEPTDVEHFRPKTEYPNRTFSWGNMFWICTTCNRIKGTNFPPHNCPGAHLIDPAIGEVWDYFLLDQFGNLIKRWDKAREAYDVRARSTCDYMRIDREEVQTRRQKRLKSLRKSVEQAIEESRCGRAPIHSLSSRVADWLAEPFQADVADYFFRGPGRTEKPFADLLALGAVVPNL